MFCLFDLDILELHLGVLSPYVDYFVLVEATKTYMEDSKLLYFEENKARFEKFRDQIIHVVVDDMPPKPADPWLREEHQRSAFIRGLGEAQPDDLIIVSDLDEIVKPDALSSALPHFKTNQFYTETPL